MTDKKVLSLRLDHEIWHEINKLCYLNSISKNEFITKAIIEYLLILNFQQKKK